MWAPPFSAFFLLLVILALGLIVRGLKGRRVGAEPRCAGCGYDLSGSVSDQCSECGRDLKAPNAVLPGRRRRSWSLVAGGAVLMLCLLAFVGGSARTAIRQGKFYRYYPYFIVLDDAVAGDPKGIAEIDRRLAAGSLSAGQKRRLAEAALDIHASRPANTKFQKCINWLGTLGSSGDLTPEQTERYHRQMFRLRALVRSPVRVGDPLPIGYSEEFWAADGQYFECRHVHFAVYVDGRKVRDLGHYHSEGAGGWGSGGWTRGDSRIAVIRNAGLAPGTHTVEVRGSFKLWESEFESGRTSETPLVDGRFATRTTFECLPRTAPDTLKPIRDPAVAEELADLLSVLQLTRRPGWREGTVEIQEQQVHKGPLIRWPVDASLDIWLIHGEGKHLLTSRTVHRGALTHNLSIRSTVPAFDDDEVYLLVRGNLDRARASLDMTEAWVGEFTVGPISIVPDTRRILRWTSVANSAPTVIEGGLVRARDMRRVRDVRTDEVRVHGLLVFGDEEGSTRWAEDTAFEVWLINGEGEHLLAELEYEGGETMRDALIGATVPAFDDEEIRLRFRRKGTSLHGAQEFLGVPSQEFLIGPIKIVDLPVETIFPFPLPMQPPLDRPHDPTFGPFIMEEKSEQSPSSPS